MPKVGQRCARCDGLVQLVPKDEHYTYTFGGVTKDATRSIEVIACTSCGQAYGFVR